MAKIWISPVTFSAILVILLSPVLASAQLRTDSDRSVVTSDLIAWTDMQSPRPIPGTSTQPDPLSATNSDQPSQTFTGTVWKQGQTCFLRISDQEIYQLDNVDEADRLQGRRVAVLGALQPGGMLIHICKIEPVS